MKTTAEHTRRVGVFVAIGIVTVALSIFFIGEGRIFGFQYSLKAHFPQIQGLTRGSVVSLSGIKVGNIQNIDFIAGANSVEVTMAIENQFKSKITEGSRIEVRTQGALGDKYLFILPGPAGGSPLSENALIPMNENADLLSVLAEKGDRATTLFDIIDDLHKLTQSLLHEDRMTKIPAQTELLLKQMNGTFAEATKLLQDVRGQKGADSPSKISNVVDRLDKILTKIEKGQGSLGALINDHTVHDQLKSLLGGPNTHQQTRSLLRSSIKHQEDK